MAEGTSGWTLPVALLLLVGLFAWQVDQSRPPVPLGREADASQYSAERAREELRNLLGDEQPHPVGSAANAAVRARLVGRLSELGVAAELQRTIGCAAEYASCASVVNVIAEVPGKTSAAIVLMSHYDSVPHAPGAGDDGAGVAALLEIARAIVPGAPYRNAVLFLFTDAEEVGLQGAEAFFAEHPAANRARVVINLEGSGSRGPVYLLRSGPTSGHLIDVYRGVASHPVAQSFAEEVFARMPNDTDFSVSMRAGVPGIDFGFAGERNHYHTPLDTVANLDLGTLQHHGENVLPLLRALLSTDLDKTAPNVVYANIGKRVWIMWSPAVGIGLATTALLLLGIATWRSRVRIGRLLLAVAAMLVLIIVTVGLEFGLLALVDRLAGARPSWPADPWPWRLVIYALPLLLAALVGPPLARRLGTWPLLLGAWWPWTLMALAMAVAFPRAAYFFIPAALVTATAATVLAKMQARVAVPFIGLLGLTCAAYFLLGIAYSMEETQGLKLAAGAFVPLALMVTLLIPLAPRDLGRVILTGATAIVAIGIGLAPRASLYSTERPQHLNFGYFADVDTATAVFTASSPEPLPDGIRALAGFERRERVVPWAAELREAADAPYDDHQFATRFGPNLASEPMRQRHRVTAPADVDGIVIWLPKDRVAAAARIAGRAVVMTPRGDADYVSLTMMAPPPDGFDIELELTGQGAVDAYVGELRWSLPPAAERLEAARGALAVPVHSGELSFLYRRVSLQATPPAGTT